MAAVTLFTERVRVPERLLCWTHPLGGPLMERELRPTIYRLLRDEGADFSQKSVQYQPWLIVAVLTWAALHDRPRYWACDPRNWATTTLAPGRVALAVGREPTLPLAGRRLALAGRAGPPQAGRRPDVGQLPRRQAAARRQPQLRSRRAAQGPLRPGLQAARDRAGQPVPAAWEVTAAGVGEAPVASASSAAPTPGATW